MRKNFQNVGGDIDELSFQLRRCGRSIALIKGNKSDNIRIIIYYLTYNMLFMIL